MSTGARFDEADVGGSMLDLCLDCAQKLVDLAEASAAEAVSKLAAGNEPGGKAA